MSYYHSFEGRLAMITESHGGHSALPGCYLIMTVEDESKSIVNFIVSPSTYFVDNETLEVGDYIQGFYNINTPVPLIYPPQFQAVVMTEVSKDEFVVVDHFNRQLINSSNTLRLNIGPDTDILLVNNQNFTGDISNRDLVVVYKNSTRSIPATTTPEEVIVLC